MKPIDEKIKAAVAATRPTTKPATLPDAAGIAPVAAAIVADVSAAATHPAAIAGALPTTAAASGPSTKPAAGPSPITKLQIDKKKETAQVEQRMASDYTKVQEVGGLIGRFLLAMLAVVIVSRRSLLRLFQVPGLILMPLIFGYAAIHNFTFFTIGGFEVTLFMVGMFVAGLVTVAQFSFWGNYLPRVYPMHLRDG